MCSLRTDEDRMVELRDVRSMGAAEVMGTR